jgi:hypothetical protein
MYVFLVQHVREHDDRSEDVKLIGVYSSDAKAQAAIARLRSQPGFSDFPDGFHVDRYVVDEDHWREGFETV